MKWMQLINRLEELLKPRFALGREKLERHARLAQS
jgi:hypothetical protein